MPGSFDNALLVFFCTSLEEGHYSTQLENVLLKLKVSFYIENLGDNREQLNKYVSGIFSIGLHQLA